MTLHQGNIYGWLWSSCTGEPSASKLLDTCRHQTIKIYPREDSEVFNWNGNLYSDTAPCEFSFRRQSYNNSSLGRRAAAIPEATSYTHSAPHNFSLRFSLNTLQDPLFAKQLASSSYNSPLPFLRPRRRVFRARRP